MEFRRRRQMEEGEEKEGVGKGGSGK